MQETILREGQRRRSPRILAMDAGKVNPQEKKPVQYVRTRFKRKFEGANDLASTSNLTKQVWKGRDNTPPDEDDNSAKPVNWRSIRIPEIMKENLKHGDQAIMNGNSSVLPAKHVLELVLDTLQRRDSYEIFAEPVNGAEVEDYDKMIKEPMDFGTMRAKLHEGLYQNLEQFEHDVFLIPENAMYFNSSATVYYRQARAIHELAQKVFDALKTDPENFLLEFSATRRRSMRKAWSDLPSKELLQSQPGSSTFRKASKNNPGYSGMTDDFRTRNSSAGNRGGRVSDCTETDRRSTFLTQESSFSSKTNNVGSSLYSSSQSLVLRNQGETSYVDSLMSFVKDLGPVAQMVAKRKLSGQHEQNNLIQPEKNMVSTTPQQKRYNEGSVKTTLYPTFSDFSAGTPSFLKIRNTIDLTKDGENENASRQGHVEFGTRVKKNNDCGLPRKEIPGFSNPAKEKCDIGVLGKRRLCESSTITKGKTEQCIPPKEKTDRTAKGKEKLDRSITLTKNQRNVMRTRRRNGTRRGSMKNRNILRLKDMANSDEDFRPVILALENPHCNKAIEYKPRNKKNLAQVPCKLPVETKAVEKRGSRLPQPNLTLEAHKPLASQFQFDLPFFQARLSAMSTKRQEDFPLLQAGARLSEINATGREGFSSLRTGGNLSQMNTKGRDGFSSLPADGSVSQMNAKGQDGYSSLHAGGSSSGINAREREGFPLLQTRGNVSEMNAKGPEGFQLLHTHGNVSEMNAEGREGFPLLHTRGNVSEMNTKGREGFPLLHTRGNVSEMNAKGPEGFPLLQTLGNVSEMKAKGPEGFPLLHTRGNVSEMNAKGPEGFHTRGNVSEMNIKGREGFPLLHTRGNVSETSTKGWEGFSSFRAGGNSSEKHANWWEGFSSSSRAGGSGDHQVKRPLFDQGGSDRSLNCSLDINKPYVFDSLDTNLALQL